MIQYLIKIAADGEKLNSAADSASKSLKHIESSASQLGARLGALFSVGKLISFGKHIIDFGGKIKDASDKTGITVEAIQEFKFAAEQSGGSLEAVTGSIKMLSRAMAEAAEAGKGDAVDALARFKISLDDIRTQQPEAVFRRMAQAIGTMPPSARLTADAMQLLGRSADELFPAFRNGFAEAAASARAFGIVLSSDTIKKLDDVGDRWGRLKAIWTAIGARAMTSGPNQGSSAIGIAEKFSLGVSDRLQQGQTPWRLMTSETDALYVLLRALLVKSPGEDTNLAQDTKDAIVSELKTIDQTLKQRL